MLAYLDALLDALAVRDAAEVTRLLAHPLVRILPDDARREARALVEGAHDALAAPLRIMQLRHRTAELLRDAPEVPLVADRATTEPADAAADMSGPSRRTAPPPTLSRRPGRPVQMELPLSA